MASTDTSFYFRIDEINHNPETPRADDLGHWRPPTARNGHFQGRGGATGQTFHWSAGVVSSAVLPVGAQLYKTATVYHHHGIFFTVPYDVRFNPVCDNYPSWESLNFSHRDNASIIASVGGSEGRLATQNAHQAWPLELFPDSYRAWPPNGMPGSLGGDLAIILALAAFSVERANVVRALHTSFGNGQWVAHGQRHGRTDGRGVVVTIYEDPGFSNGNNLWNMEQNVIFH